MWSAGRERDPKTGKVPSVGNTVDVENATFTNTIGAPELSAVWKDPEFDASQRAFYYARVHRDPDAALDGVRREALRREAAARHAHDDHGARLHVADLVHAVTGTGPFPPRGCPARSPTPWASGCGRRAPGSRAPDGSAPRNVTDPVDLVLSSEKGRLPDLLPLRHGRMARSAFTFYRGAALYDGVRPLGTPSNGIRVQC